MYTVDFSQSILTYVEVLIGTLLLLRLSLKVGIYPQVQCSAIS